MFYTPQPEEIAWARGQVRSDEHLLALMVQAKCFGRLGTSRDWRTSRRWWSGTSGVTWAWART